MKYYPISRVITGSKAVGNDFYLNGTVYTGPYYRTWENRYFSGNDPVTGASQELQFIPAANRTEENAGGVQAAYSIADLPGTVEYKDIKQIPTVDLQGFVSITPYYPIVTVLEYKRGFFFRYFAKKRNENGYLIEVNQDVHLSLQSTKSIYNYELYHSIELYWQLTGPLVDTIDLETGVRTAGIVDTNKRLTETKNKYFKGLFEYIGGNYRKYSRPVA